MSDATREAAEPSWLGYVIRAGGAERLDGALLDAVGPVVTREPVVGWSFVRFVDGAGPHLRVALGAESWTEEAAGQVARALTEGLEGADAAPAGDSLLPTPPSWRTGSGRVEVERFAPEAPDPPDGVSSEIVLGALPGVQGGRERFAFALALLSGLSETALPREERAAFWDHAARRWTGADKRGRRLLERLTEQAERLGPDLVAQARDLADREELTDLLRRHAELCESLAADREALRRHAHLTLNRLGVTPLEEAVVASILASGVPAHAAGTASEPTKPDGADKASEAGAGTRQEGGEQPVVRLQQVSKESDDATVLEDVSLTVNAGEVFALLGPPGAGKSTLLGLTAGLRVLSSGSVRVLGKDPHADRGELQGRVALGLPDAELADESSVRENLELRARSGAGGTVDDLLDLAALRDHAATPVIDLDAGTRRRVAVAMSLVGAPDVLLLDEPTAGLSAVEREEVWAVLARLRERGGTAILATSSLQEARSVADRAALVVGGAVVSERTPDELAEDHFPQRSLHFQVAERPDRTLVEELPEAGTVRVDERPDHWALEVETLQPDELLKLLGADPDFPKIVRVSIEDIEGTFTRPRGRDDRGGDA